jgi:hypothetical protein
MASPAAAKGAFVYAKSGADRGAMQAQAAACWDEARGVKPPSVPYMAQPTAAGAAAAGLATGILQGILQGIAEGKMQMKYLDACMREQGFGKLQLTQEEDVALGAAKGEAARHAWLDAFLAQDLQARIAAALTPAVPQFARARSEPFVVGGVRFDPATLVAAKDPVALKQPLLSGAAGHRLTARAAKPFEVDGLAKTRITQGAVFHQIVLNGATWWCGPIEFKAALTGWSDVVQCVGSDFEGYQVFQPWPNPPFGKPQPWLVADTGSPPMLYKTGEIVLEASPTDLLGPVDVTFQAVKFTKAGVQLEAVAARGADRVTFWQGFVRLDADGRGALPFWTRRLQLQKTEKTLSAQFTPDGDGVTGLERAPESASY